MLPRLRAHSETRTPSDQARSSAASPHQPGHQPHRALAVHPSGLSEMLGRGQFEGTNECRRIKPPRRQNDSAVVRRLTCADTRDLPIAIGERARSADLPVSARDGGSLCGGCGAANGDDGAGSRIATRFGLAGMATPTHPKIRASSLHVVTACGLCVKGRTAPNGQLPRAVSQPAVCSPRRVAS